MPLPKAGKIAIGLLSTSGIGGAGIYAYHELTRPAIKKNDNHQKLKDKLGETLLSYEDKDEDKWRARSATLAKDNSNLSVGLQNIKSATDADGSKIKEWCQTNIDNEFTSDKDPIFLEVQKYCTYNIKDKIENTIDTNSWQKEKHNRKLKELENNTGLSEAMKGIKAKLADGASDKDDEALKKWCTSAYENPFKGEKDQDYLDTKEYCVNSDP